MSKKLLDVSKIDAALQRAGRAAVSGNRDERSGRLLVREADSGRFVPKKSAGKPVKK
jgi:hypothetical protein